METRGSAPARDEGRALRLYGTVVDIQGGLTEAVTPYLEEKGWDGSPHRFVTWWRRTHFENSMIDSLCDRGHTPYREISHRALSYVMDRCGFAYAPEDVVRLVSRIETLEPFPEVPAALERLLGAGFRLAILSNGDRDMLAAAVSHVGIAFDHVISVQEAGAFKPHRRTYAKAARSSESTARPACSSPTTPSTASAAKAYGMRTAFVDRRRRPSARPRTGPTSSSRTRPRWRRRSPDAETRANKDWVLPRRRLCAVCHTAVRAVPG